MAAHRYSHSFAAATASPPVIPVREESSMLMNMLPSMVQSRMPRLPSLRRSVSMVGLKARRGFGSRPSTPPDDSQALVLTSEWASQSTMDLVDDSSGDDCEPSRLRTRQARPVEITEQQSGISWKFASQGLSLLSLCFNESSQLTSSLTSRSSSAASASFARQLYVHAVSYLLRGLPTDLTPEESVAVRSSLPEGVVGPLRLEVVGGEGGLFSDTRKQQPPSVLHRTIASTVVQVFLLVQFLLPYLKVLLQGAYDFERKNHISEKVLATSVNTVDGLGKFGVNSGLLLGVAQCVAWVTEGVSGGIQDGLGEGMKRVGLGKEKVVENKEPPMKL
jgi:hypothetical protein